MRARASKSGSQPVAAVRSYSRTSAPHDFGHGAVGGVAGVGNEHGVAGFQKRHAHVHQAFFGAQQGHNFGGRVQGHAVVALVELGHGAAQGRRALVALVAVGIGLRGRGRQGRHHAGVRRQIGTADAQVDDVGPGRVQGCQLAQLAREIVFAGVGQAAGNGHLHGEFVIAKRNKLPSLLRRGCSSHGSNGGGWGRWVV